MFIAKNWVIYITMNSVLQKFPSLNKKYIDFIYIHITKVLHNNIIAGVTKLKGVIIIKS